MKSAALAVQRKFEEQIGLRRGSKRGATSLAWQGEAHSAPKHQADEWL